MKQFGTSLARNPSDCQPACSSSTLLLSNLGSQLACLPIQSHGELTYSSRSLHSQSQKDLSLFIELAWHPIVNRELPLSHSFKCQNCYFFKDAKMTGWLSQYFMFSLTFFLCLPCLLHVFSLVQLGSYSCYFSCRLCDDFFFSPYLASFSWGATAKASIYVSMNHIA